MSEHGVLVMSLIRLAILSLRVSCQMAVLKIHFIYWQVLVVYFMTLFSN
jgi:hypothetical protein